MSSKHTQNVRIIAIYVTIRNTNINLTLSFVLHISWDMGSSEIITKFENIVLISIETLDELFHNDSEAYCVVQRHSSLEAGTILALSFSMYEP